MKNDIHHAGALRTHGAHILHVSLKSQALFYRAHGELQKQATTPYKLILKRLITPYIILMKLCCQL